MSANDTSAWNDTVITVDRNITSTIASPEWQRIFVGAFYFGLAGPSFTLHVLVFMSVLKTQDGSSRFPPFYILLANHYLADIIKTLFYLLYACPCIWAQSQVYGIVFGDFLGEFESVDYCAVLFSTFFMSVNRAFAIGAPDLNKKMFTKKLAIFYSILAWVGGAIVSVANRLLSCRTVLMETKFVFSTTCVQKPAASPGSIITYIFAYGVIVFYMFALFALAKQRKMVDNSAMDKNMKGYQIRLFLQVMAVWIGVVGNTIAFRIIPLFQPGLGTVIATGAVIIGQSYITPVSMLVFVKDTRDGIRQLFNRTNVVTLSKSSGGNQKSHIRRIFVQR